MPRSGRWTRSRDSRGSCPLVLLRDSEVSLEVLKSPSSCVGRFIFAMPPVEAPAITMHTSHPPPSLLLQQAVFKETLRQEVSPHASCLHRIICNMRTQFPDLRLIQYDCGMSRSAGEPLRSTGNGVYVRLW